jgi:hypothetical protein
MAFHHPDSDDIEAAVGGYTEAEDSAPDEDLPGSLNDKPSHVGPEDR